MRRISFAVVFAVTTALSAATLASPEVRPSASQSAYDRAHLRVVGRFHGAVPLADGRTVQVVIAEWSLEAIDFVDFPIRHSSIIQVRAGRLTLEVNGERRVLEPNHALLIATGARVRVRPARESSVFTIVESYVP